MRRGQKKVGKQRARCVGSGGPCPFGDGRTHWFDRAKSAVFCFVGSHLLRSLYCQRPTILPSFADGISDWNQLCLVYSLMGELIASIVPNQLFSLSSDLERFAVISNGLSVYSAFVRQLCPIYLMLGLSLLRSCQIRCFLFHRIWNDRKIQLKFLVLCRRYY